jgi:Mysoin-binding motif of peroxisomes
MNLGIILVLVFVVAIVVCGYAIRKTSQRVRHVAVEALSGLIAQSHTFDTVARSGLNLVQEVEIVSRGYEMWASFLFARSLSHVRFFSSNPLPPISRLESKGPDRQCHALRSGIANTIASTFRRYIEGHNTLLPFVDANDMQRYHEIYDLSYQDFQEIFQNSSSTFEDDPESLRGLKTSLMRLFIARQILLCDLLALPSDSPVPDFTRWPAISEELASLSSFVRQSATAIGRLIDEEDNGHWGDQSRTSYRGKSQSDDNQASETHDPPTPGREKVQAQLRRLDALSQSIRGLNARMLLMRDEANNMIDESRHSVDISPVLARQYDLIGSDLRNLMSEWERGRNTMLLGLGAHDRSSVSRSSSGLRSPQSPAHSLGGTTAVNEGSPAEALRRLTGERSRPASNDGIGSDEEVFEAISRPLKPKRMSMTREEKLARMQEDRRKRATLQESRDATTSMLRELETVIKHRPRGRTTSRITSVWSRILLLQIWQEYQ